MHTTTIYKCDFCRYQNESYNDVKYHELTTHCGVSLDQYNKILQLKKNVESVILKVNDNSFDKALKELIDYENSLNLTNSERNNLNVTLLKLVKNEK